MMRLTLLALCGLSAAASVLAAPPTPATPPSYGKQLFIEGRMSLPYAGIVEQFSSWYDNDKERVDFYSGMDSYIYRGDLNMTWQVNPMNDVPTCFATPGQPDIRPYFPDTTGFVLQEDAVQVQDVMCDSWQLSVTTLNKTSVYNLYISRNTKLPMRYQMMGYDSLIGSHYDLYLVDYDVFLVGPPPNNTFDQPPGMTCGDFPGPGVSHSDPVAEVAMYFPDFDDYAEDQMTTAEYAAYMAKHGKSYEDVAEMRAREMKFHANKHFVNAHQRRYRTGQETYTVGLNFLADHTDAEMAARRGKLSASAGGRKPNNAGSYHLRNYYDADLPTSVDWRTKGAVNPPQDQGVCGSCWSFGSTGSIEGAYFLKYGVLKVIAEQELVDCSWKFGNNGCDGGEDFRAYEWIMQNGGISFKENYGPYLMADGYCASSTKPRDVVLTSYVNVTEFSVPDLMDALASQGPISVSIDASHPGLSFYTGGVYYDPACKSDLNDLDHSVTAVGYGTEAGGDYWIVKNSWSTYWGDKGYIKMSRTNNNCGVASQPTYVLLK